MEVVNIVAVVVPVLQPMLLSLHHTATEPEGIHGKIQVSYDVEGIENIAEDQSADFACIGVLMEMQLASADADCILAGCHRNLYYSSYPF